MNPAETERGIQHEVPFDTFQHEASMDCPCGPAAETHTETVTTYGGVSHEIAWLVATHHPLDLS